jgi:fucose permease
MCGKIPRSMMETAIARIAHKARSVNFSFAVCCAGMASLAIGINLLPVFFTTLQSKVGGSAGLTHEQLGRIVAVTFFGLVGATLATGPLADRYGPRRFALLGNALIILGLALLALAQVYGAVLAASLVLGLGAGTLDMVLSPIVGALKPLNRSSAMNWLHSFYCTGSMATVMVAVAVLKLGIGIGWQSAALLLLVLPALVLLGFLVIHIPPLTHAAHAAGRHRLRDLVKLPYFWAALAAIALGGATEMGMASWLPAYAEKDLGYTREQGAYAFIGFLGAMTVGRLVVGMVGHPRNVIRVLMACCVGSVVFFLLASFAPWRAVALTACILAGLSGSALWPSMLAVTADRYPRGGATMYGALAGAGNAGAIVMPWIVGLAADQWTMNIGLSMGAVCPAVMLLVLIGMSNARREW